MLDSFSLHSNLHWYIYIYIVDYFIHYNVTRVDGATLIACYALRRLYIQSHYSQLRQLHRNVLLLSNPDRFDLSLCFCFLASLGNS